MKPSECITKAVYHLATALPYIEDFKRNCLMAAKHQAGAWETKTKFLISDIRSSLTEESRQRFDEEITSGDTLFLDAISEKVLRMNDKQREQAEYLLGKILQGEEIVIEEV